MALTVTVPRPPPTLPPPEGLAQVSEEELGAEGRAPGWSLGPGPPMSVLLMLCAALSALATPGQGTRQWEPCTGKGGQSWEPGGVQLRVSAASGSPSLGARVCFGGTSSPPGGTDRGMA